MGRAFGSTALCCIGEEERDDCCRPYVHIPRASNNPAPTRPHPYPVPMPGQAAGCPAVGGSLAMPRPAHPQPPFPWAIHIIQQFQYTVVRVTVWALHRQFPFLLHCRSRPSTPPFRPGSGVGGSLAVFCLSCLVSAFVGPQCCPALLGPWFLGHLRRFGPTSHSRIPPPPQKKQ